MEDYKIEKFLSEGVMGKVYLVSKYGKKYAMKIEYLSSENDPYFQTELKFVNEVAFKHPDHFMQLVDYDIVKNCKEESPPLPDYFSEEEKKYLLKLRSSGICVRKIYSLIDSTLHSLPIDKMSLEERYSMLIQLLYINYLIQSKGFVHGDFHHGNIGVINVDKDKTVKIFGKEIPTYGNQFVAIDYGGILHKDTLDKKRKYQQRNITELEHFTDMFIIDKRGIINGMISEKDFWDYIKKNNINLKGFEEEFKSVLSQPEIKVLKGITTEKYLLWDLYKLLFTKKFQQLVLGDSFKEKIQFMCFIPTADILFAYTNFQDDEILIKYFISRLENV
jgi:hypothetical protein